MLSPRKKLADKYHETFSSFKESLLDFLDHPEKIKDKLKSLITWKFNFLTD